MFGLVGVGGGAGQFATAFQLAFQGESLSAVGVYFYLARVFIFFVVLLHQPLIASLQLSATDVSA